MWILRNFQECLFREHARATAFEKLLTLDAGKIEKYHPTWPNNEPWVSNASALEIFEIFILVRSTDDR